MPVPQKAERCDALVERGIDVFANAWADQYGIPDDARTRKSVREHYAIRLEEQGSMPGLHAWCMRKVEDVDDFDCAMRARMPEDFLRCLPPTN
jgi:hypothetical protein